MAQISLRLISAIVLVLVSTLLLIPLAPIKPAADESSARVFKSTHKIVLAETASKIQQSRSKKMRQYLEDIFGVPGSKAAWYDNIIDVEVADDIATIETILSSGDERIINLCGVVSGFIYSHLYAELGIRKIKILGSSGEVLVYRKSVMDDCPFKFSRNPGLQPQAPASLNRLTYPSLKDGVH